MQPTTTNHHPEPLARICRLLILGLFLALQACGPGTGGTGTGPVVASVLGFSGVTGSGTNAAAGPPCQINCGATALRLESTRVQLTTPCLNFVYSGEWALDAAGQLVLAGTVESTSATGKTTGNASLRVAFSEKDAASQQVTLILTDSAGRTLVGPVTLKRNDAGADTAAPACTAS